MTAPSRRQVRDARVSLIDEPSRVEEIASWALEWLLNDDVDIEDEVVWDALDTLAGADIQTAPNVYLHGLEDFIAWLTDFDRQIGDR
ncbi:MAG TPA: hypothetical protein VF174_16060 [Micromonosporaceae bacterium]